MRRQNYQQWCGKIIDLLRFWNKQTKLNLTLKNEQSEKTFGLKNSGTEGPVKII